MMVNFFKGVLYKFNKILFSKECLVSDEESFEYWKNNIFSVISFSMIFLGWPAVFYGAYLFYLDKRLILSGIQFVLYFVVTVLITRKNINVEIRKFCLVSALYLFSFFLLFATGPRGAGMVCILFSIVLLGVLLNDIYRKLGIILNYIVITIITFLYYEKVFDKTNIHYFQDTWLIQMISTQVCGIILVLMIDKIYNGLKNQTQKVIESKKTVFESEQKHKKMIEKISDVIAVIDPEGNFKYISPNVEERLGWKQEDLLHTRIWEKMGHRYIQRTMFMIRYIALEDNKEIAFETSFTSRGGKKKYIEFFATNLMHDKNINGILLNFHDITERKIREKRISELSERDPLTNLYNRHVLEEKMKCIMSEANLPISIIYGDLNGLKLINDGFGHSEGDKILIAISNILSHVCRVNDMLFRVGGDEFLMILPETTQEKTVEIIESIYKKCNEYNECFEEEKRFLSISLGNSTMESVFDSMEGSLKVAEEVMYKRKLLVEKSIHHSILVSMLKVLFEKSQETEEHAERMAALSREVGVRLGLVSHQLDDLELVAKLHDIGKVGIDKRILEKTTPLTEEDWIELKKHPEIGYRIAKSSPEIMSIAEYIYAHHERWDGKGYPRQLIGEEIPLLSRIVSVVDSFDAMTEDRIYRKKMLQEEALAEIKRNNGTQFDPNVVRVFLDLFKEG